MKTENRNELISINGEYYSQKELVAIIESNNELAKRCERQTRFINALKLRCSEYAIKIRELTDENSELKFQRMLLGQPMTEEDLAIEAAENNYVPYTGDDF